MARPRKPTALKKLRGTLRKCRVNPNEWTPPVGAPEMPATFKRDARREWLRVVPMLLDAGLISNYDGSTLEAYCEAYQEWKDAARIVAKEGIVVAGGGCDRESASACRGSGREWRRAGSGAGVNSEVSRIVSGTGRGAGLNPPDMPGRKARTSRWTSSDSATQWRPISGRLPAAGPLN